MTLRSVGEVENKEVTNGALGGINDFLSAENFEKLEGIMYPEKPEAGNYLFWEGDKSEKLYYVKSGRVKLIKSTEEGRDLIISILHKGDLLGEYGGTGEVYHSYSAEVTDDAELGVIQIKDLEVLMYQYGYFAIQFMNWIGMKHRQTQSKFRDLLLYGKPGALSSTLIRMSNTYGVKVKDGIKINMKLTNTELADFIGTTRESVNRLLNAWKEKGILDTKNGMIVIYKIDDLRCICNCPSYPACPAEICRI